MLDNLLSKLIALLPEKIKERLPERLRELEDASEEAEVDVGEKTEVTEEEEDAEAESLEGDEEDEEEEDEEAEKKKRRSRLIKIFVIGGLIWFLLDEFSDEEKQNVPPQTAKKAKKLKKKPAKKSEIVKTSETQEEDSPAAIEAPPSPVPTTIAEEVNSDESILDEPAQEEVMVQEEVPTPTPSNEETQSKVTIDSALDLPGDEAVGEVKEKSAEEQVDAQINKFLGEDFNKSTQVQLERPDYEKVGEGLVYNCKGRHWACVDRKNYFRCRELEMSVGAGKPDCTISETYASIEDCQIMQIYKVNRAAPPEECKFDN